MKIIFTIFFITSLSVFSFGQKNTTTIYGGLNLAKWTDDANEFANDLAREMVAVGGFSEFKFKNESRLGFTIGFKIDFPISGNVSFQPGVFYSQKGTVFNGEGIFENIFLEEKLTMITDYFDLPLLFKLNLLNGKNKLYLLGGPSLGYLINSKMKVTVKVLGQSESDTDELKNCKYLNASIVFGAGIEFIDKIRAEIKYDAGLTSINDDDSYILKNGVISICLAYIIN